MKRMLLLSLILLNSGCAGLGLQKKATVMPDEVWAQYENVPTGAERDYKTGKVIGGVKWKFQ